MQFHAHGSIHGSWKHLGPRALLVTRDAVSCTWKHSWVMEASWSKSPSDWYGLSSVSGDFVPKSGWFGGGNDHSFGGAGLPQEVSLNWWTRGIMCDELPFCGDVNSQPMQRPVYLAWLSHISHATYHITYRSLYAKAFAPRVANSW